MSIRDSRASYNTPVITRQDLKKTPENIISTARWRKFLLKSWREVTENRTTQGIDRIRRSYQKKDYLMARVQLDQMAYNPTTNLVTPHLSIEAGPKIQVVTEGAKVSRGKLEQLIPVYQEHAVDKDLLTEGRRNLLEYLEAKGYFEADVQYNVRQQAPTRRRSCTTWPAAIATRSTTLEIEGNKYFTDRYHSRAHLHYSREPAAIPAWPLQRRLPAPRHQRHQGPLPGERLPGRRGHFEGRGRLPQGECDRGVSQDRRRTAVVRQFAADPRRELRSRLSYIQGILQSGEGQPYSDYNLATDQDNILSYY